MCGAIVLGQLGFLTRGFMIGIALLRTLKPPNFVLPLPWEIAPLFDSILNIDMPARAPTDNLLLPLRPMISEKFFVIKPL